MKESYEQRSNNDPLILQDCMADGLNLEFPVAPDFISLPPRRTLEEMLPWLERMRRAFPKSIPSEEHRLARKIRSEFIL